MFTTFGILNTTQHIPGSEKNYKLTIQVCMKVTSLQKTRGKYAWKENVVLIRTKKYETLNKCVTSWPNKTAREETAGKEEKKTN